METAKQEAHTLAQIASMLPVEADSRTLDRMTQVLSILSKDDALSIFILAKDGIKSDLDTPSKIGLTKKQYYTRLKQLVDLGLLAKIGYAYTHTAFGTIIYQKHIMGLVSNIKNSKHLEMIDILKGASKFNTEEITTFLSKVGLETNVDFVINDITRTHSTITSGFNDMVIKVLEVIEFAQKEIIMMTRFANELIINAVLKKARMGVSAKVLADTNLVEGYFENEDKANIDDINKNERINVVSNPYYPSQVDRRYVQVPFCVLVVDNKHVGIEIIDNYNPKTFRMAIFMVDNKLSNQMKALFNNLWKKSSPNPPQVATKTTGTA